MKESITTTVTVSGKGNTKQKAFAAALSSVQNKILRNNDNVLLRIEPQDVCVIRAEEKIITEKFLFFFLARKKVEYSVTLEITVNVISIDTNKIDFKLI